jgi:DNA (cytosine-5)-methyltransferase 1
VRFGSVCSGIEAASVAWHPLGWRAAWLAEIEPFPSAVLKHHYPEVPNLGDMTALPDRIRSGEIEAPDLFCGGTPCQAFSVAGLRRSLDDARGNLSLTFCEIADAIDSVRLAAGKPASIIFWENVPGVLSTADNAFGCFLAGLAGEDDPLVPPGGKWTNAGCVLGPQRAVAWRVLDAQYFGVAQRRRRVFVVASARDGFDPAAVLFEFDGVRRDIAPSREARQVAPTIPARSLGGGGLGTDFDCDGGVIQQTWCIKGAAIGRKPEAGPQHGEVLADVAYTQNCVDQHAVVSMCLNAGGQRRLDAESETLIPTIGGGFDVAHSLRGEGFDAGEDGTGRGTPLVPVGVLAFDPKQIAHPANFSNPKVGDPCHPLRAVANCEPAIALLTPLVPVTFADTAPTLSVGAHGAAGHPHRQHGNETAIIGMQPVAFDTTQITSAANYSNPKPGDPCHPLAAGAHAPAIAFSAKDHGADATSDLSPTLRAMGHADSHANGGGQMAVAFQERGREGGRTLEIGGEVAYALTAPSGGGRAQERNVLTPAMQVRRLTPTECERLQGFPDNYTAIPWRKKPASECPDGPRYKALGNSWAVPVVRWIGRRINERIGNA